MVDTQEGVLGIQWIEGQSVRFLLGGGAEGEVEDDESSEALSDEQTSEEDPLSEFKVSQGSIFPLNLRLLLMCIPLDDIMRAIGTEIAKMHKADVIHGDLTTSNMMLRRPTSLGTPAELASHLPFPITYAL